MGKRSVPRFAVVRNDPGVHLTQIYGDYKCQRLFEGTVDKWINRELSAGGYGFLSFELGSQLDRVFYKWEDIVEDNVGRRFSGQIVGAPVRFRLVKDSHKGEPSVRAVEIQSVFSSDVEDPETHREVSMVERLIRGAAFLKREHGDQAFLSSKDVALEDAGNFHKLKIGSHVWHGIRPPTDDRELFHATFAELYSEDEEAAMREEATKC